MKIQQIHLLREVAVQKPILVMLSSESTSFILPVVKLTLVKTKQTSETSSAPTKCLIRCLYNLLRVIRVDRLKSDS